MPKVILTDWREGLLKISLTKLIQARCSLDLKASKECVDRLLKGEAVIVELPTIEEAKNFTDEASQLGVVCEMVNGN